MVEFILCLPRAPAPVEREKIRPEHYCTETQLRSHLLLTAYKDNAAQNNFENKSFFE